MKHKRGKILEKLKTVKKRSVRRRKSERPKKSRKKSARDRRRGSNKPGRGSKRACHGKEGTKYDASKADASRRGTKD